MRNNIKTDKYLLMEDRRSKSHTCRILAEINSKYELTLLKELTLNERHMVSYRREPRRIMSFDNNNTLRLYDAIGATSTTSFYQLLKSRFKYKCTESIFFSVLQEFCKQHHIKYDIYFSGQYCLQDYSMTFHKHESDDKVLCQLIMTVENGCLTISKRHFDKDGNNNPTSVYKAIYELNIANTIKLCYAMQKFGSRSLIREIKRLFGNHANYFGFMQNFKHFCDENGIEYKYNV